MSRSRRLSFLALAVALVFAARSARADVITTADGSRIIGTLTGIHDGKVLVHTAFAGDVAIKQTLVTAIATDRPIAVRLVGGVRYIGIVSAAPAGISIAWNHGTVATPISRIAECWTAGQEDPAIIAARRKWAYEADLDVAGKTGNNNQFGSAVGGKATLIGPDDTLKLYTGYDRQITDGERSTDQFKAGADYADNLSDLTTAYIRDEAGYDHVMGISDYDIAAAGGGYDFIKSKTDILVGRAGLSYRYDRYDVGTTPNVSSPGADFELNNAFKLSSFQVTTDLTYVPAFTAFFKNYLITQETDLDYPLTPSTLHLKLGVSNNYNSEPPNGLQRLDTLYFTRLVFTWGATAGPVAP